MGLVDYSSDSETDGELNEIKDKSSTTGEPVGPSNLLNVTRGSNISSLLPAPKRPASSNLSSLLPPPKRSGESSLVLPPPKKTALSSNASRDDKKRVILEVPRLPEENSTSSPVIKDSEESADKSGTTSISSFLPAPKNRSKDIRNDKSKHSLSNNNVVVNYDAFKRTAGTRVLGGGIKNTFFDGEIRMPGDSIESEELSDSTSEPVIPLKVSSLSLVPAAVAARRAKYGNIKRLNETRTKESERESSTINEVGKEASAKSDSTTNTKVKSVLPSLFSFHNPESDHTPSTATTSGGYKPILLEQETSTNTRSISCEDPTGSLSGPTSKTLDQLAQDSGIGLNEINKFESRHGRTNRSEQPIEIVDFKVDDFYEENQRLRTSGMLDENTKRPVTAVSGGKHQLTSLLRSAKQNREGLEEQYAQNRRSKAESGKQYGFK